MFINTLWKCRGTVHTFNTAILRYIQNLVFTMIIQTQNTKVEDYDNFEDFQLSLQFINMIWRHFFKAKNSEFLNVLLLDPLVSTMQIKNWRLFLLHGTAVVTS